jgi:uncharacterized protein YkwD
MPLRAHLLRSARPVGVMTAAVATAGLVAPPASAATPQQQLTAATNHTRVNHDRRSYRVASDLNRVAQRWAASMASHHRVTHNPRYSRQVCCWSAVGENVGAGTSVAAVQRAFMHSSSHRSNILSPTFCEIGIGVSRGSDGRYYVDEIFRRRG